jgi:hypothetical protein
MTTLIQEGFSTLVIMLASALVLETEQSRRFLLNTGLLLLWFSLIPFPFYHPLTS